MRYRFTPIQRKALKKAVHSAAKHLYCSMEPLEPEGKEKRGCVDKDFRKWVEYVEPLYLEPACKPGARAALYEALGLEKADNEDVSSLTILAGLYSLQCAVAAAALRIVEKLCNKKGEKKGDGARGLFSMVLGGLPIKRAVIGLEGSMRSLDPLFETMDVCPWPSDLLGSLFHVTVSKKIRHAFGAYHTATPVARELSRLALSELVRGREIQKGGPLRILDPGCGSGVFLVEVYREMLKDLPSSVALESVWGFDMSPVAVFMARLNLATSYEGTLTPPLIDKICNRIRLNDSILGRPFNGGVSEEEQGGGGVEEMFDALVGNPPWVRWDVLAGEYRKKLRDLVETRKNLFGERGFLASLGGSNDDLLSVFSALAAERYLRKGGVLAFLVKQSVFTNRTGAAFRALGDDGPRGLKLGWRQAHDLRLLRGVFDLGDQQPGAVIARLGTAPRWPLPLFIWERKEEAEREVNGITQRAFWAELLEPEKRGSPWVQTSRWREGIGGDSVMEREEEGGKKWGEKRGAELCVGESGQPGEKVEEKSRHEKQYNESKGWSFKGSDGYGFRHEFVGENAYGDEVRHGLKHDAEGVFAVRVLERDGDKLVIRPKEGGASYSVEAAWVHPYIKPRHIRMWRIRGWEYVVVPQKRAGENNEVNLKENAPGLWSYLEAHRERFLQRKSKVYRKGPFYGVFGLGPYTWESHRVVWSGLGNRPWFGDLKRVEDSFLGKRCAVVDTSCYSIAVDGEDEALYLLGVLNCPVVSNHLVVSGSGAKRPFSKTALARLSIPRFEQGESDMLRVAQIAGVLSANIRRGCKMTEDQEYKEEWNRLVCDIMTRKRARS